jgi:Flp pilus assembly protein CpaB
VFRPTRPTVLWVLAVVLALVTARAVGRGLGVLHARVDALGPPVEVVVAAADLPAGATVAAADVETALAPASLVPDGALRDGDDAVGRVVTVPVLAGAVVSDRNLGDTLGDAVPAGQRVVRVVATASVRPAPGSTVDVVGTGAATELGGPAPEPAVVPGLRVLTVDPPSADLPDAVSLSVLVAAADAPRLAALVADGSVAVVLAPPA